MNWFGESWGAPMNDPALKVETPVGEPCGWCFEPVEAGDRGVIIPRLLPDSEWPFPRIAEPYHFECFIRQIAGSVGHQKGTCRCNGGTEEDPPGATPREAARAALEYYEQHLAEMRRDIRPAIDKLARGLAQMMLDRHRVN